MINMADDNAPTIRPTRLVLTCSDEAILLDKALAGKLAPPPNPTCIPEYLWPDGTPKRVSPMAVEVEFDDETGEAAE